MYQFSQKQKIIIGIIIAIIAGFICYYVYAKEEKVEQFSGTETNLEEQEGEESANEETYSDSRIFVHITGAVNQEGVVDLKANSRILDAIEAARRHKRRCIYRRHKFSISIRRRNENTYPHQTRKRTRKKCECRNRH